MHAPYPATQLVPIMLDRERFLRVDFNALIMVEQRQGRSILNPDSWGNLKLKDLAYMAWAALRHEDPTLTEKGVMRLLNHSNFERVMKAVSAAWTASTKQEGDPLELALAK